MCLNVDDKFSVIYYIICRFTMTDRDEDYNLIDTRIKSHTFLIKNNLNNKNEIEKRVLHNGHAIR